MKIVFIDRDGVINEFPGHGNYVTKVKDFRFIPGSRQAIARLSQQGYKIFVISNQAGVGKGIFSQDKLNRITAKLIKGIEAAGGRITKVLYCTHRPDAGCDCRKPNIGNVVKALKMVKKTAQQAQGCFFIGDAKSDIEAAHRSKCRSIAVLTGKEKKSAMLAWAYKPDYITNNLSSAVDIILEKPGT